MTELLTLVVYMAVLTWLAVLFASQLRSKTWTIQGLMLAMSNRDQMPEATPLAGRADRAAHNTVDNFLLFAALALVAHVSGTASPRVLLGAEIFFWSRLLYIPVYYAGIMYLRTAIWTISIVGLGMMVSAMV